MSSNTLLYRRLRGLRIDDPAVQLSRIIELDYPFRANRVRDGKVETIEPAIIAEMRRRAPARPICAHLFRQMRAHWRRIGLGRPAALLRDLDTAYRRTGDDRLLAARGRVCQVAFRIEESVENLREVVARHPDWSEPRRWLGEAWLVYGDAAAALRALTAAAAERPGDAWTRAWRAEALRLLGRKKAAQKELRRAAASAERRVEFEVLAGRDGDLRALDRALAADPDCVWGLILRGHHRHRRGDYAGAEKDFSRVVRLDPTCLWAFVMRGRARLRLGRGSAAENDFLEAMAVEPGCIGAVSDEVMRHGYLPFHPFGAPLGWVAGRVRRLHKELAQGRATTYGAIAEYREFYEFALPEVEKGLKLDPKQPVLAAFYARSTTLKGERWLAPALAMMNKAIALRPTWGWMYAWRGEILKRMGRFAAAVRDQNRCVRLGPTYPIVYAWRGGSRRLKKNYDGAIADFDRALDLVRELGDDYDFLYKERVSVLRDMGRELEAAREFGESACAAAGIQWAEPADRGREEKRLAKMARRRPREPGIHAARADVLLRSQRLAEAERSASRAIAIDDRCALAYGVRGEIRWRRGDHAAARTDIDRALALRPLSPRFYAIRANIHHAAGRRRAAIADLNLFISFLAREDGYQVFRSRLRRWTGDIADALRELDELLLVQIRAPWAHYERALCRLERGKTGGFLADLQRANLPAELRCGGKFAYVVLPAARLLQEDFTRLKRARGASVAWAWRGILDMQRGEIDAARRAFSKVPAGRCRWLGAWTGALKLSGGDHAGALADIGRALRAQPRFAWAHYLKGRALMESGRYDAARRSFDRALRLDGSLADAYADRAWIARSAGRFPAALRDMDESIRCDCRNSWAYVRRAELRLLLGDALGARGDAEEALRLEPGYRDAERLLKAAKAVPKPRRRRSAAQGQLNGDRSAAKGEALNGAEGNGTHARLEPGRQGAGSRSV